MFQRDLRQWAKDRCGMKFDSSGMCVRPLPFTSPPFPSFPLSARFYYWLTLSSQNTPVRLERVLPEDGEGGVRAAWARVGRSRLAQRGSVDL